MKNTFFVILGLTCCLSVLPQTVWAVDYDLGIRQRDIFFDKEQLLAGEKVRVYASIKNYGEKDISGYVTFWQGPNLIGTSQPISTRARGLADEVFVDWVIPHDSFNILAKIQGQDPQDQNPDNDAAITGIFIPDIDTDGDGEGDKKDLDDDNDGIEDIDEAKLGTNPLKFDTDGDVVSDSKDEYPLDATRWKKEAPVQVATVQNTPPETSSSEEQVDFPLLKTNYQIKTEDEFIEEPVHIQETVLMDIPEEYISLDDVDIQVKQEEWNRYAFEAQVVGMTPETDISFTWIFSDGYTDIGQKISRTFPGSGEYTIRLKTNYDQKETEVSYHLTISFFHLSNPWIWIAIAGMATLLLGLLFFVLKTKK